MDGVALCGDVVPAWTHLFVFRGRGSAPWRAHSSVRSDRRLPGEHSAELSIRNRDVMWLRCRLFVVEETANIEEEIFFHGTILCRRGSKQEP